MEEEDYLEAIKQNARDDEKICESCGRKLDVFEDDVMHGEFGAIYCVDCDEKILQAKLDAAYKEQLRIQDEYEEKQRKLRERRERGEISIDEYLELLEDLEDSENEDILECYKI